ncbi:hypothetical protein ACSVBT_12780 [Afipia sp. TerB]
MTTAAWLFNEAWEEAIEFRAPARFGTGVVKIPYSELTSAIERCDRKFIFDFVKSFHSGEIYVFTDAFDPAELTKFKEAAFAWSQTQESQEPRVLDGVSDYRSRRDWHAEDHGAGYSSTYDMMHFFRWNDDPIGAYKLFDPKYRILKTISGMQPDALINNIPSDGIVERAEISHYPPGVGGIAFHSDPIAATRFQFTLNLNQFGVDYHKGGFAIGTGDGKTIHVEPLLEVGSLTGFLPTVCHGVEIIDPDKPVDWGMPGRWYAAINIVTSHAVKNRSFTTPTEGYPTLREQIAMSKASVNAA